MRSLIILLLLLNFTSCDNSEQQVKDLNAEVLDLHDSSMVKMDAIYDQMARLRKADKVLSADSLNSDSLLKNEIMQALSQLQQADNGMMDWMSEYQPPEKDVAAEENLNYLEDQKKKIIEVDVNIDNSLKNGENVLKKTEQN